MSAVFTSFQLPPPDRDAILRYARGQHTPEVDRLLEEVIRDGSPAVDPKIVCLETSVAISGSVADLGVCSVQSADLCAFLAGYTHAVLFAATVGAGADRLLSRAERSSPARALLLDAFFTERAEALCDLFTACYGDPARRFSPGYGDLPIAFQRELFRVLDCPRSIGVTLSDALLMIPTKSVTAICGA